MCGNDFYVEDELDTEAALEDSLDDEELDDLTEEEAEELIEEIFGVEMDDDADGDELEDLPDEGELAGMLNSEAVIAWPAFLPGIVIPR